MNNYRSAALALAAGAVSLSAAACTAGVSTPSQATTSPAAPTRSAAAAAAASPPSPASSGSTIAVGGSTGRFPIPAGAKVVENVADNQETIIIFGSITPAKVSSFYATALPRAGYTVATNSLLNASTGTAALIQFSGHGHKGNIDALSKFPRSSVSVAGLGDKNVTTITFMQK
jgi:hypothetical protein